MQRVGGGVSINAYQDDDHYHDDGNSALDDDKFFSARVSASSRKTQDAVLVQHND